jgi:hypothetical protein
LYGTPSPQRISVGKSPAKLTYNVDKIKRDIMAALPNRPIFHRKCPCCISKRPDPNHSEYQHWHGSSTNLKKAKNDIFANVVPFTSHEYNRDYFSGQSMEEETHIGGGSIHTQRDSK